jgi:hypothetical protein
MAKTYQTLFFHNWTVTAARAGSSKFKHTFGGPPAHRGATRDECGRLLHLLHRIDLDDPLIGIEIPGAQWLPFYYCFDFRVNALGYRLRTDDELTVFFWPNEPNVSKVESFPNDDFPPEFPRRTVKVVRVPFDPSDPEDAYVFGAIFGLEKLSAKDRAVVLQREADQVDLIEGYRPESEEELLKSLSYPFAQGPPRSRCPNPACANHRTPGGLDVIALMPAEPLRGVRTFGRWSEGVQLIFELCPQCHTIHVSNQAT